MKVSLREAPLACAWCGGTIREGSAGVACSYGICLACLGEPFICPMESVATLDDAAADRLPFGFIRLDPEGRIIAYNTRESELSGLDRSSVLAKNFFRTVAPCTCVDEFEGKLKKMLASEKAERTQLDFLFKLKARATMVSIAMTTDPASGYATLLIRKKK